MDSYVFLEQVKRRRYLLPLPPYQEEPQQTTERVDAPGAKAEVTREFYFSVSDRSPSVFRLPHHVVARTCVNVRLYWLEGTHPVVRAFGMRLTPDEAMELATLLSLPALLQPVDRLASENGLLGPFRLGLLAEQETFLTGQGVPGCFTRHQTPLVNT